MKKFHREAKACVIAICVMYLSQASVQVKCSVLYWDNGSWLAGAAKSVVINKRPESLRQNHLGSSSSGLAHKNCGVGAQLHLKLAAELEDACGAGFEGMGDITLRRLWRTGKA